MGSKIDVNFERRFFHETHSRCSGGSFCRIKRVEVGNKNGAKNEVNKGRQLVIDFFIDFDRFKSPSWEGKSSKNRSKKVLKIFGGLDG